MPIPTTIAGSLPKPAWLAEPEKLWAPWRLGGDALAQGKRDAALLWLKEQEAAGIDTVTDGEQFRVHFVHGFLETVAGIDWQKKTVMGIRGNRYEAEVPTVTGPIRRPSSVHGADLAFTRGYTKAKLKVTLPGPMTICDTIADAHYGRRADMAMAFAATLNEEARELEALGADVIQLDEPAFNVFMDEVVEWGIAALERALAGLSCKTAVHICYGYGIDANKRWKETLGSEWRQYEAIFPAINKSRVAQVSLECQGSKVPLSLIRLLPDKEILVGAIDVATSRIETPQEVAAILNEAARHAPRSPARSRSPSSRRWAQGPGSLPDEGLRRGWLGRGLLRHCALRAQCRALRQRSSTEDAMAYGLDEFVTDIKSAIRKDPGPGGREVIRQKLEQLLVNKDFIAKTLPSDSKDGHRKLYEDKDQGFVVLAHYHTKHRLSPPHNHGPSWAIYGQAIGWSEMSIWQRTDGSDGRAELEQIKTFKLMPGKAGIFDIGDIHGVDRNDGACGYIRVTGRDLDYVERLRFDTAAKKALKMSAATVAG
jgi:5-methyltetrahydropteroyltriglutamate--homocysteine methyltransferase